jgi:hypothetical protein
MKTKITKNTSDGHKFYDYKGHRCVVLNAPSNTNSVLIAIATSNPGGLLKEDLAYRLDMTTSSNKDQYVTFALVPIDQLKYSLTFIGGHREFNDNYLFSLSEFLLKYGESGESLKLRIFSDFDKTYNQEKKLSYVLRQKDLMLQDPNFNNMFNKNNLNLFKSNYHENTTVLVANVLALHILDANVLKDFSANKNTNQFFDLCKKYNKDISEFHYDQLKDNAEFVKI